MKHKYIPINCSFHDVLLDRATRRSVVQLNYKTPTGAIKKDTTIKDVYTKMGEEFLEMGDGQTIRLDQIISVDGVIL